MSFTNANFIRALMIDQEGYLWAGGNGGVVRWDPESKSYKKFTSEHGLAGNFVTAIAQTSDGVLWFGTYGHGVTRYDGNAWTTFTTQDGLIDDIVLSLSSAPDGSLWAGTPHGISQYDGRGWISYSEENTSGSRIQSAEVIAAAPDGTIWIGGHWGHGLKSFDGKEVKDWSNELRHDSVTALTVAADGTLWVGTPTGVVHYDGQHWDGYNLSSDELLAVSDIEAASEDSVWVGFSIYEEPNSAREEYGDAFDDHFWGVWHYDGEEWGLVSDEDGLVDNEIRAMTVGADGSVWFGSYNQGISRYDGHQWETYQTNDGMLENDVLSIDVSESGQIWIGHPVGISHYDGQEWTVYKKIGDMDAHVVAAIKIDRDDSVWIGMYDGAAHFDGQEWTTYPYEEYRWLRGTFKIITLDDGTHIFGGKGAVHFDGETWQAFQGLGSPNIMDIKILTNGSIWFATESYGVYSYADKRWEHYTESDGLVSNQTDSIVMTPDGKIWVTSCFGISIFDGSNWQDFMKSSEEFPESCVASEIIVDEDDMIWIATGRGLIRIEGEKQKIFTVQDGLPDNNIFDVIIGLDGVIWVTSSSGFSKYISPEQK